MCFSVQCPRAGEPLARLMRIFCGPLFMCSVLDSHSLLACTILWPKAKHWTPDMLHEGALHVKRILPCCTIKQSSIVRFRKQAQFGLQALSFYLIGNHFRSFKWTDHLLGIFDRWMVIAQIIFSDTQGIFLTASSLRLIPMYHFMLMQLILKVILWIDTCGKVMLDWVIWLNF